MNTQWFTMNQMIIMALVSFVPTVVFGLHETIAILDSHQSDTWHCFVFLGWLSSHMFALVSWPFVLVASIFQAIHPSVSTLQTNVTGACYALITIAVITLPLAVSPYIAMIIVGRKQKPTVVA